MKQLSLQFLGTFQVHLDNRPLRDFRTKKVRALLAYLAVTRQPQDRSTLAGLLWPEMTERRARRNLTQTLRFLRDALGEGEWLLANNQAITLNGEASVSVDAVQFEAHVGGGRLAAAVALYQGEFLAGFSLPDTVPFEDWLLSTRVRLQQKAMAAMAGVAEQDLEAGRFDEAVQMARRQIAIDNWRERAYRQLMRALAGVGDRSGALATYEACRQALAEGLGVEPADTTTRLYKQIQGNARAPARPLRLPQQTRPFVGREEELERLVGLLKDPERRLVTVCGPGGMGKTRLVVQAAQKLAKEAPASLFLDGIQFISLASSEGAERLPILIGEALGYHFHSEASAGRQVVAHLQQKSMLLLLDNFEPFITGGVPFLLELLQGSGCQVCLTSRQRLNVQAETVLVLEGLPAAGAESAAVRLFRQTAQRIHTNFAPHEAEMAQIAAICRAVQGLPLAIVLAAAWVDTLPVDQIAREIQQDLSFLEVDLHDLPVRQRSMRAVFGYTWSLLDEQEQAVLGRLAVFQGGFTRQAARAISGVGLSLLARLVRKSLIQYDPVPERYEIHVLLRQYSLEKLAATGNLQEIRRTHSRFFLEWMHKREADLRSSSQVAVLPLVAAEQENLLAAWRWAVEDEDWTPLHAALDGLFLAYDLSGRHLEGAELFEEMLERLPEGIEEGDYLRARLLNRLHHLTRFSSQKKLSGLRQSLQLFRQRPAPLEEGLAVGWLAERAFQKRAIGEAVSLYQQQLALYQEAGDQMRLAQAQANLANALLWAGQIDAATGAMRQSLALANSQGHRLTASFAYILLAASDLYFSGDYAAAGRHIERAAEINRQLQQAGFPTPWRLMCLVYQGYLALLSGQLAQVAETCVEAQAYVVEHAGSYGQVLADSLESLYRATTGSYEAAYLQAMTALNRSGQVGADLLGLQAVALAACGLGEKEVARRNVLYVWQLSVPAGAPNVALLLSLFPVVAWLLEADGRPERALEILALGRRQAVCPDGWWSVLQMLPPLQGRLERGLPAVALAAARRRGEGLEFKGTVASLLEELQG